VRSSTLVFSLSSHRYSFFRLFFRFAFLDSLYIINNVSVEGGFGVTSNDVTKDSVFCTTKNSTLQKQCLCGKVSWKERLFRLPETCRRRKERLMCPKYNLAESESPSGVQSPKYNLAGLCTPDGHDKRPPPHTSH
jgi:hypothetical protein